MLSSTRNSLEVSRGYSVIFDPDCYGRPDEDEVIATGCQLSLVLSG